MMLHMVICYYCFILEFEEIRSGVYCCMYFLFFLFFLKIHRTLFDYKIALFSHKKKAE